MTTSVVIAVDANKGLRHVEILTKDAKSIEECESLAVVLAGTVKTVELPDDHAVLIHPIKMDEVH